MDDLDKRFAEAFAGQSVPQFDTMDMALGIPQEQARKAIELQTYGNMTLADAANNIDTPVENNLSVNDLLAFKKDSPRTAAFLDNPVYLSMARDKADGKSLTHIESSWNLWEEMKNGFKDVGRNIAYGGKQLADLADEGDKLGVPSLNDKVFDMDTVERLASVGINPFMREAVRTASEKALSSEMLKTVESQASGQAEEVAKAVVRNIPQLAAQIAMAVLTGGTGSMLFMGSQIAGAQYGELKDKGVSTQIATKASVSNALMQMPLERLGLSKILRAGGAGAKAKAIKVLRSAVEEGLTEYIQQFPEDVTGVLAKVAGQTYEQQVQAIKDHVPQMLENAAMSGLVGGILGGGASAIHTKFEKQAHATNIDNLNNSIQKVAASTLFSKSPETITQFINSMSKGSKLEIDAEGLQTYGQVNPDTLKELGLDAEAVAKAAKAGQTVAVNLGNYEVYAAKNPEIHQALKDDIAFDEDGYTTNRATFKDKADLKTARDEVYAQIEEQRSVTDDVYNQLRKAGMNDQMSTKTVALMVANANAMSPSDPAGYLRANAPRFMRAVNTAGGLGQTAVDINTPEFKAMFGNSKIADKDGKPILMFHGTNEKFEAFSKDKIAKGRFGRAFNFTSNKDMASEYGDNVIPAYLSINNPITNDVLDRPLSQEEFNVLSKAVTGKEATMPKNMTLGKIFDSMKNDDKFVEGLQALGYDGIYMEGEGIAAVFEPTQIKSATDNNGDYDPNNPNIYQQFGGEKALTAVKEKLEEAIRMTINGKGAQEIMDATGWFKGVDGKWKFEIPDNPEGINFNPKDMFWDDRIKGLVYTLSDVYDNPALFAAYPQLANLHVSVEEHMQANGYYSPTLKVIALHQNLIGYEDQLKATLIHEIQHAIQQIERFASGGSPSEELKTLLKNRSKAQAVYDDLFKKFENEDNPEVLQQIMNKMNEVRSKLNMFGETEEELNYQAFIQYQSLAGEQEAREASDRATGKKAKGTVPEYSDAVVRFGNVSFSVVNKVFHAGDLGKAEVLAQQSGGRGTGHFGTGTYFTGAIDELTGDWSSYKNRPLHSIDINKIRNLYRPYNAEDAIQLHDNLATLDNDLVYSEYDNYGEIMASDDDGLKDKVRQLAFFVEWELRHKVEAPKRWKHGYTSSSEYFYNRFIAPIVRNTRYFNKELWRTSNDKKLEYKDSAATQLMKTLGYNGVNVSGIKGLDDTRYGSVVYNLNDTVDGQPLEVDGEPFNVDGSIPHAYKRENVISSIVGTDPGHYQPGLELTPKAYNTKAIGTTVERALMRPATSELLREMFNLKRVNTTDTLGWYDGRPAETSFVIESSDMTYEQAKELAKFYGIVFQQDAVIATQPFKAGDDATDAAPALYLGKKVRYGQSTTFTQGDLSKITEELNANGFGASLSVDGRAIKLGYYDEQTPEAIGKWVDAVKTMAQKLNLTTSQLVSVRSELIEQKDYDMGRDKEGSGSSWLGDSSGKPSGLFGRTVDNVLAPYIKAIEKQGHQFRIEPFAYAYNLTKTQVDYLRQALYPKLKENWNTGKLESPVKSYEFIEHPEYLDVEGRTFEQVKSGKDKGKYKYTATVDDILYALSKHSAQFGHIEPDDYSDAAMKIRAAILADDIKAQIERAKAGNSPDARGWYESQVNAAHKILEQKFPELKDHKGEPFFKFNAILAITSQGNDVNTNFNNAVRAYELHVKQGRPMNDIVRSMFFGNNTASISENLLKFDALVEKFGYKKLMKIFQSKKTVKEWKAEFASWNLKDANGDAVNLAMPGKVAQERKGCFVLGPKIGAFYNNLNGDFSMLTADLWFQRSWDRIAGRNFDFSKERDNTQFMRFAKALSDAIVTKQSMTIHDEPKFKEVADAIKALHKNEVWKQLQHGIENTDDKTVRAELEQRQLELMGNVLPKEAMRELAKKATLNFANGGYKDKNELTRSAKTWSEGLFTAKGQPRNANEREFQQNTMEEVVNQLKAEGIEMNIADAQAALWYAEKDLLRANGSGDAVVGISYEDAARKSVANSGETYQQNEGRARKGEVDFSGGQTVIRLFEGADASTIIHEMVGHFFVENLMRYGAKEDAPAWMKKDRQTMLEYAGFDGDWESVTPEQKRDAHEKWAEAAESYIMEGKPPVKELTGAFSRFRAWMLDVYATITRSKNAIPLTDDVRQVFDRLLANDEQLKQAERVEGYLAKLPDAVLSALPQGEAVKLAQQLEKAHEKAVELMAKASLVDFLPERRARIRDYRASVTDATKDEVSKQKLYVISDMLVADNPQYNTGKGVAEKYLEWQEAATMIDAPAPTEAEAMAMEKFDLLAESMGYTSGDEMAKELVAADTFDMAVRKAIDEKVKAKFPDAYAERKEQFELAKEVLYNDESGLVIAEEKRLMQEMMEKAGERVENNAANKKASEVLRRKMMAVAAEELSGLPIKKATDVRRYMTAERAAARKSAVYMAKKDWINAVEQKQVQLFNHCMVQQALSIKRRSEVAMKYLKRQMKLDKEAWGSEEHFNQASAILARFGFLHKSLKLEGKAETLQAYAERMNNLYDNVAIAPWLMDENFEAWNIGNQLTGQQLADVVNALKNIRTIGKFERKLSKIVNGMQLDDTLESLYGQLESLKDVYEPQPGQDEKKSIVKGYLASLETRDTFLGRLDSWTHGIFSTVFGDSVQVQNDQEVQMVRDYHKSERESKQRWLPTPEAEKAADVKVHYEELGASVDKWTLIAMAANLGSESSRHVLFSATPVGMENSMLWVKGDEQTTGLNVVTFLENNLTKADWTRVQEMWDNMAHFWPMVQEIQKRTTGFTEEGVKAMPFVVTIDGEATVMRGGYFPLMRDYRSGSHPYNVPNPADPLSLDNSHMKTMHTDNSYEIARTGATYPLDFSRDAHVRHVEDTIHDIAFRELVNDFRKLLNDEKLSAMLMRKIGRERYSVLKGWLQNVAHPWDENASIGEDWFGKTANWLRNKTVNVAVVLNLKTAMQNVGNVALYANAVDGFTYKDVLEGVSKAAFEFNSPAKWNEMMALIKSKSVMMAARSDAPDWSIADMRTETAPGNALEKRTLEWGSQLLAFTDNLTAAPMWLTAYEKQIKAGATEQQAVLYADSLIRNTIGTARRNDVAAIMRGSRVMRLFTTFMSFFNTQYNQWAREANVFLEQRDIVRLTSFVASKWLMFCFFNLLTSLKNPFDEDDREDLLKDVISYPLTLFGPVGQVSSEVVKRAAGFKSYGYRFSAIQSSIDTLLNTTSKARKVVTGEEDVDTLVEPVADLVGLGLGVPAQVNKLFFNGYDILFNGMEPKAEDIVRRRPKNDR